MHALIQRVQDWLRERRIERIAADLEAAMDANNRVLAQAAWLHLVAEIKKRSPQQIVRLERDRGLSA